jgi:metal-responsive CopG/Arc/MetJ family transcriptional regulator
MKKILVSLPDGVVETLDNELIGKVGQTRSDTLRTIIMNWLSEQGYLVKGGKHEEQTVGKQEDNLHGTPFHRKISTNR